MRRSRWILVSSVGVTLVVVACAVVVATTGAGVVTGRGDRADGSQHEGAEAAPATERIQRPRAALARPSAADPDLGDGAPGLDPEATVVPLVGGCVRTPDGEPVAGAFVTLGDVDDSESTTLTGADGGFGFDTAAFYSSVTAVAVRDGVVWTGSADADGWGIRADVTLRPARGVRRAVMVHVTGPDGGDVAEARAIPAKGTPRRPWGGWSDPGRVAVRGGWFAVSASRWTPGDEPVYLVDQARGCGPALVRVDPRGAPVVEVRLPPGESIRGRVVAPDGSPVTEAPVELRFAPRPPLFEPGPGDWTEGPFTTLRTWTDRAGVFEFVGLAQAVGIVVVQPGGDRQGGGLACIDGRDGADVEVQVAGTSDATVTVADETGSPLPSATVRACFDDEACDRVDDAPDARFRLTGLSTRFPMTLRVTAPGHVAWENREWRTADTSVVLAREGAVTGRVVGPDGVRVTDPALTVRAEGPQRIVWITEGEFAVHGIRAGDAFRLDLRTPGGQEVVYDGVAPASGIELRRPLDERHLTLDLSAFDVRSPVRVVVRAADRVLADERAAAELVSFDADEWPDVVDVQVGPDRYERHAVLLGIPSRGFLRPHAREGVRLRGAFVAPGGLGVGLTRGTATSRSGFTLDFVVEDDGTFDVSGVPDEPLTVETTAPDGLRARAEVAPGDDPVRIPLTR